MLIAFSVTNFGSFRDHNTLDMRTSATPSDRAAEPVNTVSAIFGGLLKI